ncbi:DUF952 domain-containing protein [Henriciella aquimarina]|uniref:DUF952 domain-containing protein n=1 Tax=Henriciella aquimarina TaxID=545261 RepID=UPI0009FC6ADF|nr:DUF952 domain-containing protein [Henriciella aquimarina]
MIIETHVYKILSANDDARARELGHTDTDLDARDGYVHLSSKEQVAETLGLHYAGQSGVHLYEFVSESLGGNVKWEESRGGQLFPHLYGTLRLSDARRHWALDTGPDGNPVLPEALR